MAKYAISIEGAESLRGLARMLLMNSNELIEAGSSLTQCVSSLGSRLGPYEEPIAALVNKNAQSLLSCRADIVHLSEKICSQADEMQQLFGLDPINQPFAAQLSSDGIDSASPQLIAAKLVVDGCCDKADFGTLDPHTAADMSAAVRETLDEFPDLKLGFIGSLQSRNKSIEEHLQQMYLNAYRNAYPGAADKDLMPFVEKHLKEDRETRLKGFEPQQGTIAQSLFVEGPSGCQDGIIAKRNGITVNEHYGNDYGYFTEVGEADVASGWKPQNCVTPKATLDHVLGHQIARLTRAHEDAEILNLFSCFEGLADSVKPDVLSGYAATDIHEFVAEAWSEYRNNANCRDCARAVSERMIALYGGFHSCIERRYAI